MTRKQVNIILKETEMIRKEITKEMNCLISEVSYKECREMAIANNR